MTKKYTHYQIDPKKCIGCGRCLIACLEHCISGELTKVHKIDQAKCKKCNACFEVCPFHAIIRK